MECDSLLELKMEPIKESPEASREKVKQQTQGQGLGGSDSALHRIQHMHGHTPGQGRGGP